MHDPLPQARGLSGWSRRDVVLNLAIAAGYMVVGHLSLAAATEHRAVSSLWPPAGIALFALVRFGPRLWPGVAVAAYLLNASNGIPTLGALAIAGGDTLEAVLGAYLVRRAWATSSGPNRLRDVLALALLAGLLSTAVAATIGITTLVLSEATTLATAPALWLVRWSGDGVGILVVAPMLFAWSNPEAAAPAGRWRWIEISLAFVALVVGTDLIFAQWGMLTFAVFPLAGWIALRMGLRGATSAVLLVTLVASARTLAGYGPFTSASPTSNLFALQLFLVLLGVMNLLFAALQQDANAVQREVAESRARLERLSRLLLTAQEDERRRVAREVHDELGQALTAVKIGLSASLQGARRRGDSELNLRTAAATLDQAIESVQRIVLALRPGVLDNLGPIAAIEYAVQQFSAQSQIAVTLDLPPEPLVLDSERATALYRTVQEALTNVVRHAGAHAVAVSLQYHGEGLRLRIADDGRGIGDGPLRKPRSMGILGMRERAAACGGSLDLERPPTGGTVVSLSIPLRQDEREMGIA